MMLRRRLTAFGTVQGVGFRPFVYRLAREEGLTGLVRNQGNAVALELQGGARQLDRFLARMMAELSGPGNIDRYNIQPLPLVHCERAFLILPSHTAGPRMMGLSPDGPVCTECLREMQDPTDRRYRYPFISCNSCGPRYTISRELPYDRARTTMSCFVMCPDCEREYSDPSDRRFHTQAIACPVCGPRAWLVRSGEDPTPPSCRERDPASAVFTACDTLEQGRVVAIKGIGGFLLAVDAADQGAVERLRAWKRRPGKPLAVMVRNLEVARELVVLDPEAEELLTSPAVPIVVAPHREGNGLAPALAPGLRDLGIMLPTTPLHHLLFSHGFRALVMTSANAPSEPMITANRDALARLEADAYLLHNRDIHLATDDSVIRTGPSGPVFMRRARGYVPRTFDAGFLPPRSAIALGAELKVTITTLHQGQLVVGRHLGDLHDLRTERAFRQEVERTLRFGRLEPDIVAVDQHPDLVSTLLGEEMAEHMALVRVQHHHAHLCAVLVEHGIEPGAAVTGIILDGMGYGPDGTVWGGEVLEGGYHTYRRVGHLRCIPQPGGDQGAIEPARMATSLLTDAGMQDKAPSVFDERIARICGIREVSPLTSSTGRLFDGVAALLGVAPRRQSYEGEAASILEAVADLCCADAYPLPAQGEELDTRVLIAALMEDSAPVPIRAARFHNGLADGLASMALSAGNETIVLGGGCMVNRLLLHRLKGRLEEAGAVVKQPVQLPAGDGGLSAGQAAVAACTVGQQKAAR